MTESARVVGSGIGTGQRQRAGALLITWWGGFSAKEVVDRAHHAIGIQGVGHHPADVTKRSTDDAGRGVHRLDNQRIGVDRFELQLGLALAIDARHGDERQQAGKNSSSHSDSP